MKDDFFSDLHLLDYWDRTQKMGERFQIAVPEPARWKSLSGQFGVKKKMLLSE